MGNDHHCGWNNVLRGDVLLRAGIEVAFPRAVDWDERHGVGNMRAFDSWLLAISLAVIS